MAEKLSDWVRHFFTLNEFQSFVDGGYRGVETKVGGGVVRFELAPGLKLAPGELNQVRHHAVLGYGLAVQAIHAKGKTGTQCGSAEVLSTAVPLIESRENIEAAAVATRELNAPFLTVMLEGQYTDAYLNKAGQDAPTFTPEDLRIISRSEAFCLLAV